MSRRNAPDDARSHRLRRPRARARPDRHAGVHRRAGPRAPRDAETASRAAAAGGVTTIICMPNTEPVIDEAALVDFILRRARDTPPSTSIAMAAMTKGLKGEDMTEIGLLQRSRRRRLHRRQDQPRQRQVMRNGLAYAKDFGALIVHHAEDPTCARTRDERGRVRDPARPARHPPCGRDHHARARPAPRRADRRALSRRPDLLPRGSTSSAPPRHADCPSPAACPSIISRSTRTTSAPTGPSSRCGRRCAPRTTGPPWSKASAAATST